MWGCPNLPPNHLSFQQHSRFQRVTTCFFYNIPALVWAAESQSFVFIDIPGLFLHFLKLLVICFPADGDILSTGTRSSPPTTYDIPPTDSHLPPAAPLDAFYCGLLHRSTMLGYHGSSHVSRTERQDSGLRLQVPQGEIGITPKPSGGLIWPG
jgi:hypothetical protein